MLNLIVLGIDTRLVVALSGFFFFGFSMSAWRDDDLQQKKTIYHLAEFFSSNEKKEASRKKTIQ